jgi:acyl-CoA carboxylase subunit alpha
MMQRLLVANRGEIARRVFATCRVMGIETVAVYSDADADAVHVREAGYAVRLPGSAPADTYLRGDLLVAAARDSGADAVHPGYGFLSENADFATSVVDAGLTWVGPPAKAIAAMGSKLTAKGLLAGAGVPMLPSWTEPDQVTEFPVLVKASAGGGGRGMRIVREPADLAEAIAGARREAASAFGDATVFCERYVQAGRHIEVQVFADTQGTVVALGERECSIQRRHQKIVEESPSPTVGPRLRAELFEAAVAAARAVGYVGAGTVEFLLTQDGRFFFLEMNTRLQVEHPVTECVTGLDLVRLQILVAEGQPLPFTETPPASGHAIEVRLYAEDPRRGWLPSTGKLHRFEMDGARAGYAPRPNTGVRLDSAVQTGSTVTIHYDPLLAKLIAWAPTRAEAARVLAGSLARAEIHGVVTNRDLLTRVLRDAEFGEGGTDTAFLDRHPEVFAPLLADEAEQQLACLATALAGAAARQESAAWGALPVAWRNVASAPQKATFVTPAAKITYAIDRDGALTTSGEAGISVERFTPDEIVLVVAGVRRALRVHTVGDTSYVDSAGGSITVVEAPRFPLPVVQRPAGSLVAPMPGAVGRVEIVVGAQVAAGDLILTLEAMKLEHAVYAPEAGVVTELHVEIGTQVEAGAVLAVVTPQASADPNNALTSAKPINATTSAEPNNATTSAEPNNATTLAEPNNATRPSAMESRA